jgi:hypothetical protein
MELPDVYSSLRVRISTFVAEASHRQNRWLPLCPRHSLDTFHQWYSSQMVQELGASRFALFFFQRNRQDLYIIISEEEARTSRPVSQGKITIC